MKPLHKFLALFVLFSLARLASAQTNITTWQVNLEHTGNNAGETILTPGNVSSPGNFGLLFSQATDGQTYGQPLLVSGLTVSGSTHNVVYVATEHCSIFAFDADNNSGTNASPLWQVSLLPAGTVPVPQSVVGSGDITVEVGITTTPVIDTASNTIYIVSKVQRTSDTSYHQYLYALDLGTGATKFGSPVEINPTFPGTSTPDSSGGVIPFNALHEHMRAAMTLYNGIVYLSYASHSDTTPYHGEVIGYNATTLQVVKTFITTPNGGNPEGGIWQSGAGPAIDGSGNMYLSVANGAWDQNNPSYGTNWGESMIKLPTTGTFNVSYTNTLNWFTPNNWNTLNDGDLDLGSGGLLLLPDQAGPHTHIMVGGGKGAVLYVVDRDNMGGIATPDNAIQEISEPNGNWLFVTPAYFNGNIYYSASGGQLEQRAVGYNAATGGYISTTPITSTDTFNVKGDGCFISSSGTSNGIVWLLDGGGVRAYNAANVSGSPIYTANSTLPGNIVCQNTKFSLPMVANGKLYYTAYDSTNAGHLLVYGLLPTPVGSPAAPSNAVAAPNSSSTITITWTRNSTNESGFIISRSSTPTGTFTQVGTAGAGVTTYTDTGLTASTPYYYQVFATNANGTSNASNVASATTFPTYVENGLVAYWNLDETGGVTVNDVTGNGHTGAINGEAGLTTGFINNGVNLHGTGQATSNVTVANKSDLQFSGTQSFTVAAWVQPSALRGSEETIIAKSRDQGNYYGIWINSSNQWVFRGPGGDVVGGNATEGAWTHVAAVQNGTAGTRAIYVNGILSGTGAAQAGDGAGALWMGQQNVTGTFSGFPGTIDEVRVYNRALASSEITNIMGPPVTEATSTQVHGSNGTYGLLLWPFLTAQVEPRKGSVAGQYNIVLYFSAPVSGITAALASQNGSPPVGCVSSLTYDTTGKVVTVTLTGVGNAQALDLQLSGIVPGNGTASIPFDVLWGDVNGDNIVNPIDSLIVQNNYTSIVSSTANAIYDINCDGVVDANDQALVAAAVNTSLGPQIPTNLAVFESGSASSVNGGNIVANAFDNNLNTRWESTQGVDPQWIYVDLGAVCTINGINIDWETAAGQNYTLGVSNDALSWTTVVTVTNNATNGYHTYSGLNTAGRYVRMYGTTRDTQYGYSMWDYQVIGLSGTNNSYPPTVNSAPKASGLSGNPFSYQVRATNSPTSYSIGTLPGGLNLNGSTGLISGTPNVTGTFTTTMHAANTSGTGSAPLTITLQAPFAKWQGLWFTASDLANPAISGATATPAGDGITNLVKYALNLNPKADGAGSLPVVSIVSTGGHSYLALTYTQVISATDITYTAQVCGDLHTWQSGSTYTTTVSTTNSSDGKTQTVVVRDLTPITAGGKRFIRLQVTMP